MAKWKIEYKGFVYVEADTPEEAKDAYLNEEHSYREEIPEEVYEVDEFEIET